MHRVAVFGLCSWLLASFQLTRATPALVLESILPLVYEELDPIISPNAQSSHMHAVGGGSAFAASYNYDDQVQGSCTTVYISVDHSNYWMPELYWVVNASDPNTLFYSARFTTRVYYFISQSDPNTKVQAFPKGLRMLVGDPNSKVSNPELSFICHVDSTFTQDQGLDNFNFPNPCNAGMKSEIHFPSCWDGVNLYLPGSTHMSYPVSGDRNGACPAAHPIKLPSMMLEYTWNFDPSFQKGQNYNGHLAWANGDMTGYGGHADFINGWDVDILQAALNSLDCVNPANSNAMSFDQCPVMAPYVDTAGAQACSNRGPDRGELKEPWGNSPLSPSPSLPGCNPLWTTGPKPTCQPAVASLDVRSLLGTNGPLKVAANATQGFSIPTGPGWNYVGCFQNINGMQLYGGSPNQTTVSDGASGLSTTIERCQDICGRMGYPFAGPNYRYSWLCTCGMTLADNAPLVSDSMCNATCPGNSSETCGGPYYSSVWTIPTADLPNQSTTYNLGCYVSPSAAATTPGLIMASSYNWQSGSMTTEACVSGCLGFGYGWAATSYGSSCYCGKTSAFQLGQGYYLPSDACNTPCAGNATEMCGAYSMMNVYNISLAATPLANSSSLSSGIVGCYNDNTSPKGLTGATIKPTYLTPTLCIDSCNELGYSLAGVETGAWCYCGNQWAGGQILPTAECQTNVCSGNSSLTCGGSSRALVYNTTVLSTAKTQAAAAHQAGWLGCFSGIAKVNSNYTFSASTMTASSCMTGCAYFGYNYAGVTGSNCYCGSTLSNSTSITQQPYGLSCAAKCPGNTATTCGSGGTSAMDVYSISTAVGSGAVNATSTSSPDYQGCYAVPTSGAATLSAYSFTSSVMTNTLCATGCKELGYLLSGTQGGSTCSCGNSINSAATKQPPTSCNSNCAGLTTEKCGDTSRLSIYDAVVVGTTLSHSAGWVGCYKEATSGRALTGYNYYTAAMTPAVCQAACGNQGYSLAGVEAGSYCYCGSSFLGGSVLPSSSCNTPCSGDATQGCGGSSIVQLYNSTDLTPVTSGGSAGNGTNSTSTPAVAGGALGCYSDGVLYTAYTSPVMTNAGCVQQCYAEGYAYAATASGNICRCTNTKFLKLMPSTSCNSPCAGSPGDICGSSTTSTVFSVSAAEAGLLAAGQAYNQTSGNIGYIGCLAETKTGGGARLLNTYKITSSTMTPTVCINVCSQANYTFAGVEAGNTCMCANAWTNSGGGGYPVADSNCNTACAGDSSKTCGGGVSYVQMYNAAQSSAATGFVSGNGYDGCYNLGSFVSASPYNYTVGVTAQLCKDSCGFKGYAYAGLLGSKNCYCGNSGFGSRVPDLQCSNTCAGDATQTCGGSNVLSILATSGFSAASPGQPENYDGCWSDNSALNSYSQSTTSMTPATCIRTCTLLKYKYAGLKRGNYCYCGSTLPADLLAESSCNTPCVGNSSAICGGSYVLSVYDTTGSSAIVQSASPTTTSAANSTTTSAQSTSAVANATLTSIKTGSITATATSAKVNGTSVTASSTMSIANVTSAITSKSANSTATSAPSTSAVANATLTSIKTGSVTAAATSAKVNGTSATASSTMPVANVTSAITSKSVASASTSSNSASSAVTSSKTSSTSVTASATSAKASGTSVTASSTKAVSSITSAITTNSSSTVLPVTSAKTSSGLSSSSTASRNATVSISSTSKVSSTSALPTGGVDIAISSASSNATTSSTAGCGTVSVITVTKTVTASSTTSAAKRKRRSGANGSASSKQRKLADNWPIERKTDSYGTFAKIRSEQKQQLRHSNDRIRRSEP